ncbi:MAG: hypothetical protein KAJ76_07955 [Candidatus Heimdallarchaeota archaeon]|nr:hypothetical protein [Candidatus Heimdallarchaeota archaeon]MCK5159821.1 hypothetical protein [Candidatus Heimdallarchaeota archaeon]MCK5182917.1 hypothetical protein [Candidatus Heimdallarchaeota archaeon]MCK5298824.1 hypothetical protein [Candidatus Heimdallarchaeota archaeon]
MNLIECAKVKISDALVSPILPESVKNDLEGSGNVFLTIYSKKSKTLRFFPTKDDDIWWLKIAISSFSPETSGNILAKLNKLITEFVYSTGVCISKSDCFWDGIILDSSFKTKKEEIINTIKEIPNVKDVTMKAIE